MNGKGLDVVPRMAGPRPERMNSPLELREVRLRGLHGKVHARRPDTHGSPLPA